jgi:hypothetical protein
LSTNRLGVIFSIDALVAAILLALFAATIGALAASSSDGSISKLLVKKQTSDLLLSMDKSGLLSSMDYDRANLTLQAALQPDMGYLMMIEYYNYTIANLSSANYSRGNESRVEKIGSSQRRFVVARPNELLFGIATLSVWKE